MTREELIKRLSYRGQFGQLIVDTVGIGSLLDEAIAMLETDDDIIQDLTSVVKYYQDKYKEAEDGKVDDNIKFNIMEILEYYQDKIDGIDLAIEEIKRRFFNKEA